MKAEIEKILEMLMGYSGYDYSKQPAEKLDHDITQATSSLTALIIKWLEGKKRSQVCKTCGCITSGRNQLITGLIGEVR